MIRILSYLPPEFWSIFILAIVWAPNFLEAGGDDLFLKAFGKSAQVSKEEFFIQLSIQGQEAGESLLHIEPEESFLESKLLLEQLHDSLHEESLKTLRESVQEDGFFAFSSLESLGYKVIVDRDTFTANVEVPAKDYKGHVYG